ncbi:hypothetical protein [Pseudoalteromonas luteoviolacea]|uniref:Metallo-beta-lactamase domain-containing protein n=1 Tax=Pseudoalteromonas luteoviolacea S4054 TaxID=1129367 RepID=A0A0F6A9I6_9GAMM|nr:hypothetical protein [Pseudoalteromonas luteoviolacea]AOT08656.1 hypothetical protein S4054249_12680 [Pseudoalteromonas luteoviolacea]AOT13571.1 hypothetical protein S40542_12655 [Pseudoalteromonas luteoviolacea]AOT18484.1 hypothetical protein S4054_12655 [Pseudoalteromonas luteoviolacea]KKE82516.1 hypothetical protein N479_18080 [Pseudoalteromonas luteoviolacea S4054]KZN72053.1 hypothetical protein N481_16715 [Pseudoalteromonas luteoviolacea S4047-1]
MCVYFFKKVLREKFVKRCLISGIAACQSHFVVADTVASDIIEQAVSAYGAQALSSLKQLKVEEELYRYMQGQSGHAEEGPHGLVMHKYKQQLDIDFTLQAKAFKRSDQNLIGNYGYHSLVTVDRRFKEGKGVSIDHCMQTYQPSVRVDWDSVALGMEQGIDTLTIKELSDNSKRINSVGSAYIQGDPHSVLQWKKSKVQKTAYIDKATGLLSRLLIDSDGKVTRYDFLAHEQNTQGLKWASETIVSRKQTVVRHVTDRHISLKTPDGSIFHKPKHYQPSIKDTFLDFAQPSVNEIVKGAFLVGQGWGFTLFVDIGASYISMGSWQMPDDTFTWKQRLAMLHQFTGNTKPVSQFIVTHHHDDHLMGLNEVMEHGAQLLLLAKHQQAVEASLGLPLTPNQAGLLSHGLKFADNKVQVFDVPSSHADHNLVVYLPEQQILFAEDMFGSSLKQGFHSPNSWPSRDVYYRAEVLNKHIKKAGVRVQHYVSSHHGRVFSDTEFMQFLRLTCPDNTNLLARLYANESQ